MNSCSHCPCLRREQDNSRVESSRCPCNPLITFGLQPELLFSSWTWMAIKLGSDLHKACGGWHFCSTSACFASYLTLHLNGSGCWEDPGLTIYLSMATPPGTWNPDCYVTLTRLSTVCNFVFIYTFMQGKWPFNLLETPGPDMCSPDLLRRKRSMITYCSGLCWDL